MKENLTRALAPYRRTFAQFTSAQKAIVLIGTGALLIAGFLVFRWASTPSYAPLFGNLTAADAAAVIDELDADGVPYKLSNGGATVMVPQDKVYATRIRLSGQGLPSASDSGYSLLDEQSLSTSQFQEQTNFKRAMEAELANTIEAINGVRSAVVHLALPPKQVFADEQDPATASVLVSATPGAELDQEQVQAVVHLVASSIDGLAPEKVTVADSTGKVLSATDGTGGLDGSRSRQVTDYQDELNGRIQGMLDKVVGAGNSTVAVTANLDLDKAVRETKSYTYDKDNVPLSETRNTETYSGTGAGSGLTGVVGPDGQMDSSGTAGGAPSSYKKSTVTADNAVGQVVERRETAPGSVRKLHVGVVVDAAVARNLDLDDLMGLISNAIGIDAKRGDTVQVSTLPFDRTAEEAAKAELAAADKEAAKAEQMSLYRNIAFGLALLLVLVLAWLRARRRAKAREEATTYVVEQLRQDALERANTQPALEPSAAMLALEKAEASEADAMRQELEALVERQPEDVAALLRGWLVERP